MRVVEFETAAEVEAESPPYPSDTNAVDLDAVARLASTMCRTPLGMVMLLEPEGQWYKASGALRLSEPTLASVFCDLTLSSHGLFTVPDTTVHERLKLCSQVTRLHGIRFFAGAPIVSSNSAPLGVLCIADMVPRVLTSDQEDALELLGRHLAAQLELRTQRTVIAQMMQEKAAALARLRASEELFRAFMNASPFLSYIKDAAGRLLFYNSNFAKRFGVSEVAWLGKTDEQLWSRHMSAAMRMHDLEVMHGGRMVESEEQIRTTDGSATSWKTYKFPCQDSAGNTLLAGVAVDLTEELERKSELERYQEEMEEANDQLRRLSVTDQLTGLSNRRAFEERLVLEFSMARRRKRDLSVMLLDIDFFKRINDQWGHAAGDAVLRSLAAVLRTTVRLPDMVARYGGEEFAVLLPESGVDAALGLANRLMERIASEPWENQPVTASIGIASLTDLLVNGFDLVQLADEALYGAKRTGRNRAVIYGREPAAAQV